MAPATAPLSYFQRPPVRALIFGAFFVFTVPLAIWAVISPAQAFRFLPAYGVTIGLTHFLVTGLIYFDARNLRYFASTTANKLIYFAVPIAILVGMDVVAASGARANSATIDFGLLALVMVANFLHVSRQSFGVLQLFKRQAGAPYTPTHRSVENLFFLGLVVLQCETFYTDGRFDPGDIGVLLTTGLVLAVFSGVVAMHAALILRAADRRAAALPLGYFALQALAGSLAVYETALYNIALAMHYVEYHVVMMPRILRAPVEPTSHVDRARSLLRRAPILLYAGLVASAWSLWLVQRSELYALPDAGTLPLRLLFHALDGIFLAHFFVEAFVWRFSKPHYRETLGPLYFAPAAPAAESERG